MVRFPIPGRIASGCHCKGGAGKNQPPYLGTKTNERCPAVSWGGDQNVERGPNDLLSKRKEERWEEGIKKKGKGACVRRKEKKKKSIWCLLEEKYRSITRRRKQA